MGQLLSSSNLCAKVFFDFMTWMDDITRWSDDDMDLPCWCDFGSTYTLIGCYTYDLRVKWINDVDDVTWCNDGDNSYWFFSWWDVTNDYDNIKDNDYYEDEKDYDTWWHNDGFDD